jgi:hypothetical protein
MTKSKFRDQSARSLMALTLAMDPTVAPELRQFLRMSTDVHPDYMHVRDSGGKYHRMPDPGAWLGTVNARVGVALLRDRSGGWFLNGF